MTLEVNHPRKLQVAVCVAGSWDQAAQVHGLPVYRTPYLLVETEPTLRMQRLLVAMLNRIWTMAR
jgi:hypothetical protein